MTDQADTYKPEVDSQAASEQTEPDRLASQVPAMRITLWMLLIATGFLFEFTGRFFGFRGNPSGLWLAVAPLLTTISAASIIIYSVFGLSKAWLKPDLPRFRNSLLVLMLGLTMLIGSMICKSIVATLFG